MCDSFFAALDPAGPFAAVCGITWVLLGPTSAVSALVAGALCPFSRMSRQAFRLSRVGVWSGLFAFCAAAVATVTVGGPDYIKPGTPAYRDAILDSALLALVTGIAPLVAFFTGRYSQKKMLAKDTQNAAS